MFSLWLEASKDSNLSASKYDEGASHIYNPKCWLTPFIADFKALFTTELSVSTLDYLMASVWLSMIILTPYW